MALPLICRFMCVGCAPPTGGAWARRVRLAHGPAALGIFGAMHELQASVLCVAGGEQHALAHAEAHFSGRQVGDTQHALADEYRRVLVRRPYAREDLDRTADVHFESEELICAFDELCDFDDADAEVELRGIIEGNLGLDRLVRHALTLCC